MQSIYQWDVAEFTPEQILEDLRGRHSYSDETRQYVEAVVAGVIRERWGLDKRISERLAPGWHWDRIAKVERAVLRLAAYELLFMPALPPKVTINEAVNLAKTFGNENSGSFINGLLGRLLQDTPKANWDPTEHTVVEEEAHEPEPEPEQEPEMVEEGSETHKMLTTGKWTLRSEEDA